MQAVSSDNGAHQSAPVAQTHAAAAQVAGCPMHPCCGAAQSPSLFLHELLHASCTQATPGKQTNGAPVNGAARAPSTGKGPPKAAVKKAKAFANNNRYACL